VQGNGALTVVRSSLAEQLAALRGVAPEALPAPLLEVAVRRLDCGVFLVHPSDWEALREEEAAAGRPVPFWARPWPSGIALAAELSDDPPAPGTRVLELGCGLAAPSIVAARAGANVLASDGVSDAVVFAAHSLALNEAEAEVAHADWDEQGEQLVARGPFDLVLGADVLYMPRNAELLIRLLPQLLAPWGEVRLADPGRANARVFFAAARATFSLRTQSTSSTGTGKHEQGDVSLYRLIQR
jgi:predicted nicotinamide N-methyase